MNRSIRAGFILVQADGAHPWSDAEIKRVLAKFLNIWAGTVDGELKQLDITIDRSEPARVNIIFTP